MRTVLENGLTVVVEEVRAAPVVALQAWVKVGSADETEREAGLAHLHEHMLFKGTERRGPGAIARDVESRGGEINAWTSFDQTVYHLVIASRFFEEGLDILSDAVLASAFDPEELSREIEVVIEEIKRSFDIPARRASRELFALAYERHPYRRPVIGYEETVRSFTRDDVLSFYKRNYTPDDMVLVIAGDVSAEKVLPVVRSRWGQARGKLGERAARAPEPAQRGTRVRLMKEPVQETHLALAWHGPDVRASDLAAVDLCAGILGQGDSARLPHRVKSEQHLVTQVYAYAYTPHDPGLLVAGATLEHEKLPDAVRSILREVARLGREGPTATELNIAKHMVESEAIWQRETVQGMARKLGFYETVAGSLDFEKRYYEAIRATTAEEVRAVCEKYTSAAALSIVALGPTETAATEEDLLRIAAEVEREAASWPRAAVQVPAAPAPDLDRPAARRSGKRREVDEAGIVHGTLASGTRVLVKPEPAVPLVAVRAVWNGGVRHENDRNNGIHQLVASLLSRGTTRRSARDFALETDRLAASVNGNSGRNSFGLRGDFLSRHFEESMRLLAEALLEPAFDPREVEREKARQLQDIRARADNPSGTVFDLFARTLYTRHPYRLDGLGEEASVSALTAAELPTWYRTNYGTGNLVLSVVGDVDPEAAFDLAEELFGHATGGTKPSGEIPQEPPLTSPRKAVEKMEKQQAHLVLGFPGVRLTDHERFPLDVLASVLAGQGGRLFTELRDKRSMAYSITAFSMEGVDPGYFGVYMGTSPEKLEAAVEGIRAELAKVQSERVPDSELERARRYLVGAQAIGLQKNASRAAAIAFDEAYGVGASAYTKYAATIEAVTAADVQESARRTIDLERSVLAVVTPTP